MTEPQNSATQTAVLAALANGVIPSDATDDGASAVNAGPRLCEKIAAGVNAVVYMNGLRMADEFARERFDRPAQELTPAEIDELLALLRERAPGFFKQLRMDVSALYLSDPEVWKRIGFPGPSFETGGYPDFDQLQ